MKIEAKIKGKTVGYVEYEMIGKEKHKLYELKRIEIDEEYRRNKIGHNLMLRLFSHIIFRKLFLTTHKSNIGAQKFYKCFGFKEECVIPNHYYAGEDELVMSFYNKQVK